VSEQPVDVDYRFVLANERTFLAWMRTALGLIAGGVALDQFVSVAEGSAFVTVVAFAVMALGALVAVVGVLQWRRADAAMYEARPLPRTRVVPYLGISLVVVAVAIGIVLALG
jgi:putative membrane protein